MTKIQSSGARSLARRLAMQALYQHLLTGYGGDELLRQFAEADDYANADAVMLQSLIEGVVSARESLDARIGRYADRPLEQLDPVEHAILWIGIYEFEYCIDTPYKVVIDEAVRLSRRYGAEGSYKYVNALLDSAASEMRVKERLAASS